MDSKELETVDKELEVVNGQSGMVEGAGQDDIDSLMFLADNIDKIIEAKNKIRTALYRLAKPGDWTIFTSEKDAKEGKEPTAELGHAGSMRISSTVGISFGNATAKKENGVDDKGPWYRWDVECDASYRGNKVRAYGRAGTRDKFFGKAYGEMKDISDISEGDIKMAAIRGAQKEGVKCLLGLHHIPAKELELLGVQLGNAKGHKFQSNTTTGQSASAVSSKMSEAQGKRLWAITKNAGKTEEQLKTFLKEKYKIDSSKDIEKKDYEDVCTWAQKKDIEFGEGK